MKTFAGSVTRCPAEDACPAHLKTVSVDNASNPRNRARVTAIHMSAIALSERAV
jgi:hypothetical protein